MLQYYDRLRAGFFRWGRGWFGRGGEHVLNVVFLLPDIVRLLIKLLADPRVFLLDKVYVGGVLAYIISPFDLLPEMLAGPFGLVEDLVFAVLVLYRLLGNPYNARAIQEHWQGEPRAMVMLQGWCQTARAFFHQSRRR